MKKSGILHSDLAAIVAGMGHGDKLVICDCGYPIPHDKPMADCVLTVGTPGLVQTLKVVLGELHIEGAMMAKEVEQKSPAILKEIQAVTRHGADEEDPAREIQGVLPQRTQRELRPYR